jgi:hypothetical protein
MIAWFKKMPLFVLFLGLAIIYTALGFLFGYATGYSQGQADYIVYIEKLTSP